MQTKQKHGGPREFSSLGGLGRKQGHLLLAKGPMVGAVRGRHAAWTEVGTARAELRINRSVCFAMGSGED